MRCVHVNLPPDVSEEEARLLLAIRLFEEGRVSVGRAAEIAGYSRRAFSEILLHRGVPVLNSPGVELEEDLHGV